jgi:NAD(P)-dependent dehydrogenase (short-subunit alcohol dehydrogenase family)
VLGSAGTRQVIVGHFDHADEVAPLMLFLASEESRYCTGGVYSVDGGMSAVSMTARRVLA